MRSSRQSATIVVVRALRRGDEPPWVRVSKDGAGEAPLAQLPCRPIGIKNVDDPSGRTHIVAPDGAAAVQPLARIPAGGSRAGQSRLAWE
jgi:hypothetical protein